MTDHPIGIERELLIGAVVLLGVTAVPQKHTLSLHQAGTRHVVRRVHAVSNPLGRLKANASIRVVCW